MEVRVNEYNVEGREVEVGPFLRRVLDGKSL